ncbi:MAG: amidohydrolase [Ginsengibacter sp.]
MRLLTILLAFTLLASCNSKEKIDLLVYNANVYTVDSSFSKSEAIAVKDGKIVEVGTSADLQFKYDAKENIDADGKYIYPGFIDAHAHFLGYGLSLQVADLVGTESWNEILVRLKAFAKENPEGWIRGRGWDQNDWDVKEFPINEKLNELFPDRPVVLTRVDGHASIANNKAIEMAGIKAGDKISGGDIEVKNGKLSGILVDNAMGLVSSKIPSSTTAQLKEALLDAQRNCFAAGLTTIDDCGLHYTDALLIDSLQKAKDLKMRLFVMLSDSKSNYDYLFSKGKIKTDRLNVSSFKVYADGALGSRGACLLQPYSDKLGWTGFLLSSAEHFDSVANIIYQNKMQMCTHAIGDSANRVILKIYAKYLKGKNDLRWRIEHAQVVNKADFALFGENSIVPSVQPTHATSDMYWAGERLGPERVKDAYAYKQLLQQNNWIPLGTDFPVEDISPMKTFFASAVRKDAKGWPPQGFQMENVLTREQTLRGMTIWAAKSNFEEHEKGSLEKGKFADFIMMDKDLMNIPAEEILGAKVIKTFVGGEKVFEL